MLGIVDKKKLLEDLSQDKEIQKAIDVGNQLIRYSMTKTNFPIEHCSVAGGAIVAHVLDKTFNQDIDLFFALNKDTEIALENWALKVELESKDYNASRRNTGISESERIRSAGAKLTESAAKKYKELLGNEWVAAKITHINPDVGYDPDFFVWEVNNSVNRPIQLVFYLTKNKEPLWVDQSNRYYPKFDLPLCELFYDGSDVVGRGLDNFVCFLADGGTRSIGEKSLMRIMKYAKRGVPIHKNAAADVWQRIMMSGVLLHPKIKQEEPKPQDAKNVHEVLGFALSSVPHEHPQMTYYESMIGASFSPRDIVKARMAWKSVEPLFNYVDFTDEILKLNPQKGIIKFGFDSILEELDF
jgi:hypothetical protein